MGKLTQESEAGLDQWAKGKFTMGGRYSGDLYGNTDWAFARLVWSAALERTQLSQGGEAVAWHTDDHLTDKSATTYDREVAERWRAKGWPVTPLHYTHAASQEPHKNEVNGLKRDLKKKEVRDGSGS